jgi:hypothetical protein
MLELRVEGVCSEPVGGAADPRRWHPLRSGAGLRGEEFIGRRKAEILENVSRPLGEARPLYAVSPIRGHAPLVSHRHDEDFVRLLQIHDTKREPSEAHTSNPSGGGTPVPWKDPDAGKDILNIRDELPTESGRGRLVMIYGLEELLPSLRKEREVQH